MTLALSDDTYIIPTQCFVKSQPPIFIMLIATSIYPVISSRLGL